MRSQKHSTHATSPSKLWRRSYFELPQIDCPLTHEFAPGVYFRTITMPAGAFIIGAEHVTSHWNLVTKGRVRVMMDGEVQDIVAPHRFVSSPGVRKILYIVEETEWSTIHPTDETDVAKFGGHACN